MTDWKQFTGAERRKEVERNVLRQQFRDEAREQARQLAREGKPFDEEVIFDRTVRSHAGHRLAEFLRDES